MAKKMRKGFDEDTPPCPTLSRKRSTEQEHKPDMNSDHPMRPIIKVIEDTGYGSITDVLTQEPLKKLEDKY